MGWDGVYYGLPMFLVAWGTLIAGGVPMVWGWGRIAVQKHNTGNRIVPKTLCVVTASLGVNPTGFIIFLLIPFELKERFAAFLVCCAAMVFGSPVS